MIWIVIPILYSLLGKAWGNQKEAGQPLHVADSWYLNLSALLLLSLLVYRDIVVSMSEHKQVLHRSCKMAMRKSGGYFCRGRRPWET